MVKAYKPSQPEHNVQPTREGDPQDVPRLAGLAGFDPAGGFREATLSNRLLHVMMLGGPMGLQPNK